MMDWYRTSPIKVKVKVKVKVRVRTIIFSVDPGIELGLTVFVTSRRYRQTNFQKVPPAQALKEIRVRVRVRVRVRIGTGPHHSRSPPSLGRK